MCCTYLDDAEARYLRVMADGLSETKFSVGYQQSDGLCLPHTRGVLRLLNTPALVELVMKHQRAVWEKLKAELALYIVRYGQRAEGIDEAMGEEATSWQRAVRLFASDAD
jgi:hypothetical protein